MKILTCQSRPPTETIDVISNALICHKILSASAGITSITIFCYSLHTDFLNMVWKTFSIESANLVKLSV
jgi:hypothetical protein